MWSYIYVYIAIYLYISSITPVKNISTKFQLNAVRYWSDHDSKGERATLKICINNYTDLLNTLRRKYIIICIYLSKAICSFILGTFLGPLHKPNLWIKQRNPSPLLTFQFSWWEEITRIGYFWTKHTSSSVLSFIYFYFYFLKRQLPH